MRRWSMREKKTPSNTSQNEIALGIGQFLGVYINGEFAVEKGKQSEAMTGKTLYREE